MDLFDRILALSQEGFFCAQIMMLIALESEGRENPDLIRAMLLRFAQRHMPCVRGIHFQPLSYFGRCSLAQTSWRLTIPRLLQEIESQTGGQLKACDFAGGGAEHPYCSVHDFHRLRPSGRPRFHQAED